MNESDDLNQNLSNLSNLSNEPSSGSLEYTKDRDYFHLHVKEGLTQPLYSEY